MEHDPGNKECYCQSCCARQARESKDRQEGYDIASKVTDYLNGSRSKSQGFVEGMQRQHRTLQQSFTALCIAWLEHCASLADKGPGYFDLRNQDSVEFAKKLVQSQVWEDSKYLRYI